MKWLLDTNVLIHAQRGHPENVRARLMQLSPYDIAISAITIAELWYGAARTPDPLKKKTLWRRFVEPFLILPFDAAAAELHGELRHSLRQHPIGERDLIIACTALSNDLTLASANTTEFERVPGLRLENWTG
ncbi:MAG: type II toxin-antitoxin system VapC family toxin [Gemmatimonadota bacterium]